MRGLAITVVFAGAVLALWQSDFVFDGAWATLFFLAVCVAVGFAAGEWWVIGLATLWLVVAALFPHDHDGLAGTLYLVALFAVPAAAVSLGLGVIARRSVARRLK